MAIEKKKSMNETVDRMKYLFKYALNEASYTLVDGIDEDDTLPEEIYTGNEPRSVSPISPTSSNVMEDEEPQMDNEGLPVEEPVEGEFPEEEMGADEEIPMEEPMGMEEPIPEEPAPPSANEIQNNILKSSISAMQKMNDELGSLESTLGMLNSKIDGLNKDVEEVREPTNVEKLMSKKEDSHPFYYNLNDMWDGNSFQARREVKDSEEMKGMKQTEDGSYVADFDTLPKYTDQEVNDSF